MDDYELISSVLPGQTINISTREVIYHSYINGWYRWFHSENRMKLLSWVEEVIHLELRKSENINQRTRWRNLMHGLRNLAVTYHGDKIVINIMSLVREIEDRLLKTVCCSLKDEFQGPF